jgi:hypothetical protein
MAFVTLLLVGCCASKAADHLHFMSMYSMDAAQQQGWINMGLESSLQSKLDAFEKIQESLYGDLPPGILSTRGSKLAGKSSWIKL